MPQTHLKSQVLKPRSFLFICGLSETTQLEISGTPVRRRFCPVLPHSRYLSGRTAVRPEQRRSKFPTESLQVTLRRRLPVSIGFVTSWYRFRYQLVSDPMLTGNGKRFGHSRVPKAGQPHGTHNLRRNFPFTHSLLCDIICPLRNTGSGRHG